MYCNTYTYTLSRGSSSTSASDTPSFFNIKSTSPVNMNEK